MRGRWSAAEIARLRSEQTLLGVLREIATDPAVPPHIRLKAAEAGVAYETPKLSASWTRLQPDPFSATWTDDYSNILGAMLRKQLAW